MSFNPTSSPDTTYLENTIENHRDWRTCWNSVDERAAPQDFLRQVGWTIGGQPVGGEQVSLAVEAAHANLRLKGSDRLLDLCCGNGLVTAQLAARCASVYAVDFSEHLLEVARQYHCPSNVHYLSTSVTDLTGAQLGKWRPDKISMLAALQHFTVHGLIQLIDTIGDLTRRAAPIYFSDVPDVHRLYTFYNTPERRGDYERRRLAGVEAIGTWWSRRHLVELFASKGYALEFVELSPRRSSAHYRFDMVAKAVP
jgi:2-polyprenyl-3-methyl-5-hydroxy-6-metoxy-1,4-benzoquinol methylase